MLQESILPDITEKQKFKGCYQDDIRFGGSKRLLEPPELDDGQKTLDFVHRVKLWMSQL